MVQIFLVRHGQANSEAKDEISYDKLSSLGKMLPLKVIFTKGLDLF